ncbi:glycosyltransferase [Pseudoalteromonas sp. GW168-MNA-CIBAN-0100]|uniref:glycosyltransferase n=1 Tax=Pseudoalteromonas sp. GW168-MNA-CIBAN-0100 TaxID=3140434 RepID=UPI0033297EB8
MKVIHIISKLDPGGIERWLIDISHEDTENEHVIIACSGEKGKWYSKFNGDVITDITLKSGVIKFQKKLNEFIEYNNVSIVHSHLYRFSAFVRLALLFSKVKFIAHSHNDKRFIKGHYDLRKRTKDNFYSLFSKCVFRVFKTNKVAASVDAAQDLFGSSNTNKVKIIHCGIDLNKFNYQLESSDVGNASFKTFITIGSLTEQKNHLFLLDLFSNVNAHLIIVGEGKLRIKIEEQIKELNLSNRVTLLGNRDDIPYLLKSSDGFIFPSIFEGLGLAFIEAQAAGLNCIISDKIPREADIVHENILRLPLDNIKVWIEALGSSEGKLGKVESYNRCSESTFNIERSSKLLSDFYISIMKA